MRRASCRPAVSVFAGACAAAALLFGASAQAQAPASAVASDVLSNGEHRVVFVTAEALVPEDTDNTPDIYVRRMSPGGASVTELVSNNDTAPFGGTSWEALGARAGLVYGLSIDNPNPFDHTIFVFVRRSSGWVRFVAAAGNVGLEDILNDGSLVVRAGGKLVPEDNNSSCDLYRMRPPQFPPIGLPIEPQPELLTPGVGSSECPVLRGGFVSPTGATRVVFETDRPLLPNLDLDFLKDVYGRSNGVYQLFSRASGTPQFVEHISVVATDSLEGQTNFSDDFGDAISPEADTVIFKTAEKLVPADTNNGVSSYVGRFGTATPLLVPGNGVGKLIVNGFLFFESKARLAGNLDDDVDVFRMNLATGEILHVSRSRFITISFPSQQPVEVETKDAFFMGAAADGSRVWFRSFGSFGVPNPTPDDADDLFEAKLAFPPGSPDHLRIRTRSRNTEFHGRIFGDPAAHTSAPGQQANSMFLGATVLFKSMRQLASAEDVHSGNPQDFDVYALTGNVVRLVSTPTSGDHPEDHRSFVLGFAGTPYPRAYLTRQPKRGVDERLVVFETTKRLASTDTDSEVDVYLRNISTGTTTQLSVP